MTRARPDKNQPCRRHRRENQIDGQEGTSYASSAPTHTKTTRRPSKGIARPSVAVIAHGREAHRPLCHGSSVHYAVGSRRRILLFEDCFVATISFRFLSREKWYLRVLMRNTSKQPDFQKAVEGQDAHYTLTYVPLQGDSTFVALP